MSNATPARLSLRGKARLTRSGATCVAGGVNFSVFSRHASSIELLLFDRGDDKRPVRVIPMDAVANRTYHYWHVFVPGAAPGQIYALRADGPFDAARGCRFDPSKVLLDPYGRAVLTPAAYDRTVASQIGVAEVGDGDEIGCGGPLDVRLGRRRAPEAAVLTHHHLRDACAWVHRPSELGVTCHKRGTYAGLIDKIPYLQQLGITAVESCQCFNSTLRTARPGKSIIGGTHPSRFSLRIKGTAREGIR